MLKLFFLSHKGRYFLKLCVVFLSVYFVSTVLYIYSVYDVVLQQNEKMLIENYYLISDLMDTVNDHEARDQFIYNRLTQLYEQKSIHFYQMKINDQIVDSRSLHDLPFYTEFQPLQYNKLLKAETATFVGLKKDSIFIVFGKYHDFWPALSERLTHSWQVILFQIVLFLLGIMLTVVFTFSDYWTLQQIFSFKGKKKSGKVKSQEAQTIVSFLNSQENEIKDLSQKSKLFDRHLLPALSNELNYIHEAPYSFNCAVVSIDVNRYTYIQNHFDKNQFFNLIDDLFTEATKIIIKYKGYVKEYLGDEVIFYFKENEHNLASLSAVAASLEILNFANKLNRKKKNFEFTVKASVSFGKMNFFLQAYRYVLSGPVMIEASRILQCVSEEDKSESLILLTDNVKQEVDSVVQVEKYGVFSFKGVKEQAHLYKVKELILVGDVLEDSVSLDYLAYYRSDGDCYRILKYLRQKADEIKVEKFIKITNWLKDIRSVETQQIVCDEYLRLLKVLRIKAQACPQSKYQKFLSAIVLVSTALISQDKYDEQLNAEFQLLLNIRDYRVVANVIEVLTHFEKELPLPPEFYLHKSNRVLANAIIKNSVIGLNDDIFKQINKLLSSKEEFHVSSGLYALGTIASNYKQEKFVEFQTSFQMQKMLGRILDFIRSDSESIRRQAFIAARKINDKKLCDQIEVYTNGISSEILYLEAKEYFFVEKAA